MKRIKKGILFYAILISITITVLSCVHSKTQYGNFKKAVAREGSTLFSQDNKIKYSNMDSYRIENKDFNNAIFYKNVKVKKNTPYKITCMIKTENVEVLNNKFQNSGAKIRILNSAEQSNAVVGSTEWKEVVLVLNSKQNDNLDIGFMLGGDSDQGNVKGTAWFSEMKIEEGTINSNNKWNFACIILKNTDVTISGNSYKYKMSETDIKKISECMSRFKNSIETMSNNQMKAEYKVYTIDTPLNHLSFDVENGYYIDPSDVSEIIDKEIPINNFDHIFVCARLDDKNTSIPTIKWRGLGSMEYKQKGFSNIKVPKIGDVNDWYYYNENTNKFPEEVFVHEFLHSLEKFSIEHGYTTPKLHSYNENGYVKDKNIGLYDWYTDYMNSNIGNNKIGLTGEVYKMKPVSEENFKASTLIASIDENIEDILR